MLTIFIRSVSDYSIQTGTLVLKHNFPTSAPRSVTAHVNIELVSSSLKPTDTQIGEWVNVIGHITDAPPRRQGTRRTRSLGTGNVVNVQAVVLWSAGSVKLGDYERILGERREVERRADK